MRFVGALRAVVLSMSIVGATGALAALPAMAADKSPTDETKPVQASPLEKFKASVDSLNLTDEQKPKIEALFAATEAEIKKIPTTDAKAHSESIAAIDKLRTDVAEVVTPEQNIELVKKVWSPILIAKGQRLHNPDMKLDKDQLKKCDDLIDGTLLKLEEISQQGRAEKKDIQRNLKATAFEMQTELEAILTDEQKKMYLGK